MSKFMVVSGATQTGRRGYYVVETEQFSQCSKPRMHNFIGRWLAEMDRRHIERIDKVWQELLKGLARLGSYRGADNGNQSPR